MVNWEERRREECVVRLFQSVEVLFSDGGSERTERVSMAGLNEVPPAEAIR